jgi:hypothetical protein
MMLAAVTVLSAADDPAGWSKARWGMTDAQLSDAFGADTTHSHGRIAIAITLAGIPCRAEMIPDQAGHLDAVLVEPVKSSDMTDSLYLNLQDLLVQKYGRPWKSGEESGVTKLQWTFPTTLITLDRAKFPSAEQRIVALVYKRITPESNPL